MKLLILAKIVHSSSVYGLIDKKCFNHNVNTVYCDVNNGSKNDEKNNDKHEDTKISGKKEVISEIKKWHCLKVNASLNRLCKLEVKLILKL